MAVAVAVLAFAAPPFLFAVSGRHFNSGSHVVAFVIVFVATLFANESEGSFWKVVLFAGTTAHENGGKRDTSPISNPKRVKGIEPRPNSARPSAPSAHD